jgi:purine-binding chemotaxis protein CheW
VFTAVTFTIGEIVFAAEISKIQEVKRRVSLSVIPGTPDTVAGLYNMRGRIVTIYDLNAIFKNEQSSFEPHNCICVILKNKNDEHHGFIVDKAGDVQVFTDQQCDPVPANGRDGEYKYTEFIVKQNNDIILMIDPKKIIDEIELSGGMKV